MFKKELIQGTVFTKTFTVTSKDTASAYGSGDVNVLATPAMISFMEGTALSGIQPSLSDDFTTVGIEVCIKHIKATPVGMKVTCKAILKEVDGAKLTFDVEAKDEEGKIGIGTHKRFIINLPEFMAKTED